MSDIVVIDGTEYEATSMKLTKAPRHDTQMYTLVLKGSEKTLVVVDFAYDFQAWPQEQAAKLTWFCQIVGWGSERGKGPYFSRRVLEHIERQLNASEENRHFEFRPLVIHEFEPKVTLKHIREVLAS